MSKSIFKNKEDKNTKKSEHAALMTVIGPGNLLILLGIIIFLARRDYLFDYRPH